MQGTNSGVGSALRKARLVRGVSLDEASRDTRIRLDSLAALEAEEFEALLGDVYVRGALRSYATYLGLDPERVVAAYSEGAPEPAPAPPPPPTQTELGHRKPGNHRLAFMVAGVLLITAAAFGVISSREPAPPPSKLEDPPAISEAQAEARIDVTLFAHARVHATVVIDDVQREEFTLQPEEQRSLMAVRTIELHFDRGGLVEVTVNGDARGAPGERGEPWERTFSFGDGEA